MLRQIALQCPERALVLLRLRDEQRMTMEVYQTLYHESLGFGQSQAVQVEKRIQPAQDKVDTLKMQIKGLKERIRIKQEEIEVMVYECIEFKYWNSLSNINVMKNTRWRRSKEVRNELY